MKTPDWQNLLYANKMTVELNLRLKLKKKIPAKFMIGPFIVFVDSIGNLMIVIFAYHLIWNYLFRWEL